MSQKTQCALEQAFENAARPTAAPSRLSRTVLLLFSGPYRRPDGLAAFLRQRGLNVVMLDNDAKHGGVADDITKDKVYDDLLRRCRIGEFLAVLAAPPCSTFSVSRFFAASDSDDGGPPPVRDAEHIYGLPDVHTRRTLPSLRAPTSSRAEPSPYSPPPTTPALSSFLRTRPTAATATYITCSSPRSTAPFGDCQKS